MAKTLFDKIWRAHQVADLGDGISLILVDRVLLHERTGAIALRNLQQAGRTAWRQWRGHGPALTLFLMRMVTLTPGSPHSLMLFPTPESVVGFSPVAARGQNNP